MMFSSMKKLEDKIIKKVYQIETKKTASYLFFRLFFGLLFGFFALIFTLVIFDILIEQKSFDLLYFFQEDFEVFRKYFFINIINFYQELPQPLTIFLLMSILLILGILLILIKNFNILKNKILSIYKFYKKK